MLHFYSIQSAWGLLWMILIQPWSQVIHCSLPGLTRHVRLRIGISHLSISGIMVYGSCYITYCFNWFVIFCFCVIFNNFLLINRCFFFVFMFLDSDLNNQEALLICWLYKTIFWLSHLFQVELSLLFTRAFIFLFSR